MSGWWLASYIGLWALVVLACFVLIGVVRSVAVVHAPNTGETVAGAKRQRPQEPPAMEDDGPSIGSPLPYIVGSSINGHGEVDLADAQG